MKFSIAKFAKSKYFVPGIVIGLVVFGWLVLLIAKLGPFGEEKEEFVSQPTTWSQKEDYVIKETPEGKFVINEKAGLSFKVPEGWRVELPEETAGVYFLEKNTRLEQGIFVGGCAIVLAVDFRGTLVENTRGIISYLEKHPEEEESDMFIDIIEVARHKALKKIGQADFRFGKSINIEIPLGEKLCHITTRPLLEEEERCLQEFDKFLETVSIK